MKTIKIMYWLSTGLIVLMMLFSAFSYLTQEEMKQGFTHMGYPSYFRVELAVAKILGAILLIAPVAMRFKEWAYAGFGITFISASIAHAAIGDPAANVFTPMLFFPVLAISYWSYHRLKEATPSADLRPAV